jgi:hypothetical protein
MRAYWKRVFARAWADTKRFVAPHKTLYTVSVSMGGGALSWAIFGADRPNNWALLAFCVVAANLFGAVVAYMVNLVRAPALLDADRATAEATLRAELARYVEKSPKSVKRQIADLKTWIPQWADANKTMRMWLGQVVPPGIDHRDYIKAFLTMVNTSQVDAVITGGDPTWDWPKTEPNDIEFKVRTRWWP